jgi:membrane protein DedA with SNARE-associated domain
MRASPYAALDAVAALLWAAIISLFGLKLTGWLHAWIGHLKPYEHPLILGALVITLTVALWRQWHARK